MPRGFALGWQEPRAGCAAPQVVLLMVWCNLFSVQNTARFQIFANRRQVWLSSILNAYYTHCHIYVMRLPVL